MGACSGCLRWRPSACCPYLTGGFDACRRCGAQVEGVVTGGRVVGGRDVVAGAFVPGDTEVAGAFPPPPPLVVACEIATTATIATRATIAATSTHNPREPSPAPRRVLAASSSRSRSTRAPQWGQNVAPGVSGSPHTRQRSVALAIGGQCKGCVAEDRSMGVCARLTCGSADGGRSVGAAQLSGRAVPGEQSGSSTWRSSPATRAARCAPWRSATSMVTVGWNSPCSRAPRRDAITVWRQAS